MVGKPEGAREMTWLYYRHKPTEIRATQWQQGTPMIAGVVLVADYKDNKGKSVLPRFDMSWQQCTALIEGQQGWHMVKHGDYICRGAAGELYPVPVEIFEANYERKEGQPRGPIDDKMQTGIEDHVRSEIKRNEGA